MSASVDLRLKLLAAITRCLPLGGERVLNLFFDRDQGEDVAFSSAFFGQVYDGNLTDYIDQSVFFFGAYCPEELLAIRDVLSAARQRRGRPVTYYDIGANVGHHAVFASAHADRVLAFEPVEALRAKIADKVERNRIANIEVFPVALSDTEGEAKFYLPQGSNQGGGSLMRVNANREDRFTMVPVRRGDAFIAERDLPPLDVVKIDVEGNEARVLDGLKETLLRDRPVVLLELSPSGREVFGDEAGFRGRLYPDHHIYEVLPRRGGRGYKLGTFSFARSVEILIAPAELP